MSSTPATSRSPTSPRSRRPSPTEAARLLQRCQSSPGWFSQHVLGAHLVSYQDRILNSVREHRRTAVRSGNGLGKTATAGQAVLWFLFSYPHSRVITTATTWHQVEKQLWQEIQKRHRSAVIPLGGQLLQTEIKLPDGRYAIGLSTRPEHLESFQGHHAVNLLLVFDEASGIPTQVFEAGEGYMTGAGAKWLMIGNPTRTAGDFFNAFHKDRAQWSTMHLSAFDAPAFTGEQVPPDVARALVSREWVQEKQASWGEDSPLYQVRVLGNFPRTSDDTVIALGDVEEAQRRELPANVGVDRITIGCDVARYGNDETVIATKIGPRVRLAGHWHGNSIPATTGRVLEEARKYPGPAVTIVVDDDGVGGGVTDLLRIDSWVQAHDVTVVPFRGGERAYEPESYPNRRSEHWFAAADRMPDLDLDADDQLAADLTSPKYTLTPAGQRKVELKAETKKRLGRSPDRADAVLLTLVQPPAVHVPPPAAPPTGHGLPMDSQSRSAGTLTGDLLDEKW